MSKPIEEIENIEIGFRIRELRLEQGLEQADIAKKMGYKSYSTISKWENGINLPNGGKLAKLALLLKTTTDYILNGEKNEQSDITSLYESLDVSKKEKLIDYANQLLIEEDELEYTTAFVEGVVAAGDGIYQEDNLRMEVRLLADQVPTKYDTIATVVGDSMEPLIKNNDLLFINIKSQVDVNDIGIFQINGKNFVKKLKRDYDGSWYLQSLNRSYEEIHLSGDDDIRTIGEVVEIYRG